MRRAGNHRWDARTVFSDDPLAGGGITPHIRDDLKFNGGDVQAKIYGLYEALARIGQATRPNHAISHQPKMHRVTTKTKGPAQRDSS